MIPSKDICKKLEKENYQYLIQVLYSKFPVWIQDDFACNVYGSVNKFTTRWCEIVPI